jgi:hypothetical protein
MGKVGRPIKRTAEAVVKDIRRQTFLKDYKEKNQFQEFVVKKE